MPRPFLVAVSILAVLASCSRKDPALTAIDDLLAPFSGDSVPGASVLVVQDGRVTLARAFGMADLESGVPATTATNYRLASLTKQFTASAVLLLVRDGKLALETPLKEALPEFPEDGRSITLRHLLTHTSGVPDYEPFVPDTQSWQVRDRDVLEILTHTNGTDFPPGSAYSYSNSGYALLAMVVERVSGQSFAAFLHDRMFEPLGMGGTVAFEEGISTVSNRAFGYTIADGSGERTDQSTTSAVLGDGGVYSSVDDLAKWDDALARGLVLDSAEWREATTPARLTNGSATEYGFGWFVDSYRGRLRHRHGGDTRGFNNVIMRFPDDRLTIVVLTNRDESGLTDIGERIADLFLP
jgi:CubicO group peptidase (beta-lactamase class C family)